MYTALVLFFFPAGNIVTQVEATGMLMNNNLVTTAYPLALGVLASAIGLGWSNATLAIAAYCGRKYGVDSEQSNAVIGVGLALLSLFCEFSAGLMANKLKAKSRRVRTELSTPIDRGFKNSPFLPHLPAHGQHGCSVCMSTLSCSRGR